jgi:hypothetical protein
VIEKSLVPVGDVSRWLGEVASEQWKPALHWDRLPKNQPAEITMFQISEVQEAPGLTVGGVL